MLKSKISNITNPPVALADFKAMIGGINHALKDAEIQRHLDAATIWVAEKTNIPAMDFDVQLVQDKATLEQDLLFDNITIASVKDLITGDDITYTTDALNSKVILDAEYQLLINYSCTAVANPVLNNSILRYAIILYSGQTDEDAMRQIIKDLRSIQSEIY